VVPFTATGLFSDGTSTNLTAMVAWQSSDTSVAAVSAAAGTRGLVTALAPGMAQISATFMGVVGATALTVTGATLTAIQVTPFISSIPAGFSESLVATGLYSDGTNRDITRAVTWTSDNSAVATVSDAAASKGLVASVAPGTAAVTAQLGGTSGDAMVTVSSATLVSIAIQPANPSVAAGGTVSFTAAGTFTGGLVIDVTAFVTWTSSNTSVADVSNADGSRGQATAFATGSTTVQARRGSVMASTTLTVK
jgi:hypothetical protein